MPAIILADEAPGLAELRAQHEAILAAEAQGVNTMLESSDAGSGSDSDDEFEVNSAIQLDTLFPHAVYDARPRLTPSHLRVNRAHALVFADSGVVAPQARVAVVSSAAEQELRTLILAINDIPVLHCVRSLKAEMSDYLALRRRHASANEVDAMIAQMVAKLDTRRLPRGYTLEQVRNAWFTLLDARVSMQGER